MNKIIKTLSSAVIMAFALNTNAQIMEFESVVHDFGTLSVSELPATATFVFTNKGDKPLVIQNVSAGCSCTSPGYTKEPVKQGEKGEVLASYNAGAGPFSKTLTVSTNGGNPVVLTIKGDVLREPENLSVTYPDSIGSLRIRGKRDLNFSQIDNSQVSMSQIFEIANASAKDITVAIEGVPEYITATVTPTGTLTPNEKGQIILVVDGKKAKNFGFNDDAIVIKVGNVKETIHVSSLIAEKIEAEDNSPKIEIENNAFYLGEIKTTKATGELEIKNVGNSDLVIKSFSTDNTAFASDLKKEIRIKPGKSGTVKYSANNLQKGVNDAQIFLSTNDPKQPLLKYAVKVSVVS